MKNPIFIEHYTHEGCNCYKVLNPFTSYAEEKHVLCRESEGYEKAVNMCKVLMNEWLKQALSERCIDTDKELAVQVKERKQYAKLMRDYPQGAT